MKLLFIINTPGQAHTWKYVIRELGNKGHSINILARDSGSTLPILRASGFQYDSFKPVGSRYSRLFGAVKHFQKCYELSRSISPSMVIGFGIDAAVTAARLRKPCIVFIDDDHTPFQNNVTRLLANAIVTPGCFRQDLGKKHIRVNGYKELAYLHPNYFRPDATIFDELKMKRGEKYILLRFNAWDAVHDIGKNGFLKSDKFSLVEELGKYARVFISPEGLLPEALEKYRLLTPYDRFHQVLYHAQMFVSDTGTAASEAVILGTPAVFCSSDAISMGNFRELSEYGLLYYFSHPEPALKKAVALIQEPGLKEEWAAKRQKMLAEKVDVSSYMVEFITSRLKQIYGDIN